MPVTIISLWEQSISRCSFHSMGRGPVFDPRKQTLPNQWSRNCCGAVSPQHNSTFLEVEAAFTNQIWPLSEHFIVLCQLGPFLSLLPSPTLLWLANDRKAYRKGAGKGMCFSLPRMLFLQCADCFESLVQTTLKYECTNTLKAEAGICYQIILR